MLHAYYSDLIQSVMIYQNSHNRVYIESEDEKGVSQLTGKMVAIDHESIQNERIDSIISKFENFSIYKISTGFPEEEIKIYGNVNLKEEILHIFESGADVVTIGMVDQSNENDFVISSIFSIDSQILSMFDYNFEFPELSDQKISPKLNKKEKKLSKSKQSSENGHNEKNHTEKVQIKKNDSNRQYSINSKKSIKNHKTQSLQLKQDAHFDKKQEKSTIQTPKEDLPQSDQIFNSDVEPITPISSSMMILKQLSSKIQSKVAVIEEWKEKAHLKDLKYEKLVKKFQSEKLNTENLTRNLNQKEIELKIVSAQLKELQDEIHHLHDLIQLE